MHRRSILALMLLAVGAVPGWAGEPVAQATSKKCCPDCGSARVAGNEVAGVCLECGQATLLGVRLPLAVSVGIALCAGLGLLAYRLRGRLKSVFAASGLAAARPGVGLAILLAFALSAGPVLAAETEATVVRYDKDTMKLVVKAGEKERTVQLKKNTHVHYPEGNKVKEVKLQERPDYLKKGVKVVIEEENGRLIEINIKK